MGAGADGDAFGVVRPSQYAARGGPEAIPNADRDADGCGADDDGDDQACGMRTGPPDYFIAQPLSE